MKGKGCGMKWKKEALHCAFTCLRQMLYVVVWIVRLEHIRFCKLSIQKK